MNSKKKFAAICAYLRHLRIAKVYLSDNERNARACGAQDMRLAIPNLQRH